MKIYYRFVGSIKKGKYDVGEVFALSPIPLLIHLGTVLSDTVPLTIYQYDRDLELWVNRLPIDKQHEVLNPSIHFLDNESEELIITISISSYITKEDMAIVVPDRLSQLSISIENPHVKRVLFKDQVKAIQKIFKDETEKLLRETSYKKIHLFYSRPTGLAIELRRNINPRMWPKVMLYQFNIRAEPRYSYALSV